MLLNHCYNVCYTKGLLTVIGIKIVYKIVNHIIFGEKERNLGNKHYTTKNNTLTIRYNYCYKYLAHDAK